MTDHGLELAGALIGFIQAFIFMLLTVIYFGAAREGLEHDHERPSRAHGEAAELVGIENH